MMFLILFIIALVFGGFYFCFYTIETHTDAYVPIFTYKYDVISVGELHYLVCRSRLRKPLYFSDRAWLWDAHFKYAKSFSTVELALEAVPLSPDANVVKTIRPPSLLARLAQMILDKATPPN